MERGKAYKVKQHSLLNLQIRYLGYADAFVFCFVLLL